MKTINLINTHVISVNNNIYKDFIKTSFKCSLINPITVLVNKIKKDTCLIYI